MIIKVLKEIEKIKNSSARTIYGYTLFQTLLKKQY